MKLIIQLDASPPPCNGGNPRPPIEDRLRNAISSVDNGLEDARESWELIRRLYNYLVRVEKKGKCSKRMYDIIDMVYPVIEKYGQLTSHHIEHRENSRNDY